MIFNYIKNSMLKHPEQTISDETSTITYKQLIDYAERFGKKLTKQKYGLLFKSELETAKALLSCLYAKKTAVILSEKYGKVHNDKIINSIKLSHILTDNDILSLSECDEYEDLSNIALIMCTSGTTGYPKGAMITYENLLTNLIDIESYFHINNRDHIFISRPLYHCAVLTGEFLISLLKGLQITFYSGSLLSAKTIKLFNEKNCNVFCGTPSMFHYLSLVNLKSTTPIKPRIITISGECMNETTAKIIRDAFPNTIIYSVYGLTEASPRVCYLPPDKFDEFPLSIGIPLNSLEIKIVDNELLVKGKSIMKGYYNDIAATKSTIVDGWLHTGDIAEQDDKGMYYIKCRKDNMIIRAGMNIYPQEIENTLKKHPKIKDVLVFGSRDSSLTDKINIRVVVEKLTVSDIFEICKNNLSSYQMPDSIEIVTKILKNASGKVMRNEFTK